MSRHTPGPWRGAEGIVYALSIDGKTNRFIAQVSGGYVHHGARNRTGAEELFANAHLIAAAPDLLTACREAQQALRRYTIHSGSLADARARADALDLLNAAILKAKGVQP